jgi:hypothetical protein
MARATSTPAKRDSGTASSNRLRTAARQRAVRLEALAHEGFAGAHMAGGADAALQQPGLDVEAMRVPGAVRPLQARGEDDALTGVHRRQRGRHGLDGVVGEAHLDARRDVGPGGQDMPHLHTEAPAGRRALRHAAHRARDPQVLPLPVGWQFVCQAPRSLQRRPAESGAQAGQQQRQPAQRAHAVGARPPPVAPARQQGQQQEQHPQRWQPRLLLQQPCPEGEQRAG